MSRRHTKQPLKAVELASGDEVDLQPQGSRPFNLRDAQAVAFVGGGKWIASGMQDGKILLYELNSKITKHELMNNGSEVLALVGLPDGKRLAASYADSTILIWNLPTPADSGNKAQKTLTNGDRDAFWENLQSPNATEAYKAAWTLATECPEPAVALLRDRLRRVEPLDEKVVAQHLRGLADNEFEARQKAVKALKEMGEAVLPALRQRLATKPTADEAKLLQELIDELEPWSAKDLRVFRAIYVLELIGTPEAKKVLEHLAGGMAESRLTQEAKASVKRLTK